MRLFIGVELDDRMRAAAADVAERLRQHLQRAVPELAARWIAPDNLHITLWFIGEVADAQGDAIAAVLKHTPFSIPQFDLGLAGCGAFPPSGPPRVFWIGVNRGGREMADLYREIGDRLTPLGYEPERRAYTAHLTIGRVKDPGRGGSKAIRETLARLPADCGTCRISGVTMFRSRLSPRGAAYEPLLRVPLS
jgi:RNA 2',3'-cyclic 3'-phosphodiesterase